MLSSPESNTNYAPLPWGLLLDGFDPFLLLLRRGRRYSVNHVVALDDAPVRLRLTGFDDLAFVVGVVKLKAVLNRDQRAGQGRHHL